MLIELVDDDDDDDEKQLEREETSILIEYSKTRSSTQPRLRSTDPRGSRLQSENEPPQGALLILEKSSC